MKPSKIQIGGPGQNLTITTQPPQAEGEGTNVQIQYGDQMEEVLINDDDEEDDPRARRLTAGQRVRGCMTQCKAKVWTIVAGVQIAVWVLSMVIFSVGFGIYRYYVWIAVLAFYGIWTAIFHILARRLGGTRGLEGKRWTRWRWVVLAHAITSSLVLVVGLVGSFHPGFSPDVIYKDAYDRQESINMANGLILAILGLMELALALTDLCYRRKRQTPPPCPSISEYIENNKIGPSRSDRLACADSQSQPSTSVNAGQKDGGGATSGAAASASSAPVQPVQVFIINSPQSNSEGQQSGKQEAQGQSTNSGGSKRGQREKTGKRTGLRKHGGPSYETFNGPYEGEEMPPPYCRAEPSAPPGYQSDA